MTVQISIKLTLLLLAITCLTSSALYSQSTQKDSANYYYNKERSWSSGIPVQQKNLTDSGAALCILNNKIYRVGSAEFKKLPLKSLELYSTIVDETSNSGYHYIFFYRWKKND
ncbi:hypothetical protein [Sediminibacterium soli]|uniref:hypothetical protein n=1 Tax=Sediminibacterium soli TaxID=2698829 RepID=UPI00137A2966|nr:hypothetical protein [Sediminibacterium soli]NCI45427.1 hypothetical protein [Sediminibacterium soli]